MLSFTYQDISSKICIIDTIILDIKLPHKFTRLRVIGYAY